MDLKQIKQIIDLMKRSELTEFAVEEEGFKLKIRRGLGGVPTVSMGKASNPPFSNGQETGAAPVAPSASPVTAAVPTLLPQDEPGVSYIKSPMVGTFYRSPSPDNKPYVEIGTKVSDTAVVCIIEAMKIMNEIQSEQSGTISEILAENGQPVEYGQRLFKVRQV